MFNLEQAISEWRRQMLSAGVRSPVPLQELESHLREEIERQAKLGVQIEQAFQNAMGKIGPATVLDREFKKSGANKKKRIIVMLAGVIGVAIGMALVMPAMALYLNQSSLSGWDVAFLIFGAALTLGGGKVAFSKWRAA
ncbi:MAG TPA: hypothetical protein VGO67_01655 [Verrucomicrobiae bacterium]|jgi:hypothetical protein